MLDRFKGDEDQTEVKDTANPSTPADPAPRTVQFQKACRAGEKIFVEKNAQYGDTITATGVLGASVELIGTSARLKQLVLKSGDGGEAAKKELVDILKDIHNYANIALLMLAENNWTGE